MSFDKKRAMGRGLSAILSEKSVKVNSATEEGAEELVGNIIEIDLNDIIINPNQPRKTFDPVALEELSRSIKQLGLIQPITVRKNGKTYDLISGERRFRASKLAGIKKIPAFIRIANDNEVLEMALVENIQRRDLDPIEIALSFDKLISEIHITQENLSNRIGKDRSTITNYLRLLKLPPEIQNAIRDSVLSMGHGKALMSLNLEDDQLFVFNQVLKKKLSVRETERMVREINSKGLNVESKNNEANSAASLPNYLKRGMKNFEDYFQSKVEIKTKKNGSGTILLSFDSEQDFERLQKLIEK